MVLLSSFLMFAVSAAEAHPEILAALVNGVGAAIDAHEQHPAPASSAAIMELRAGIAAAASSAVTSVLAKQTPKATAPASADAEIVSPPPVAPTKTTLAALP